MRETIELGSAPADEPCAQVGSEDYSIKARNECRAYCKQLHRAAVKWMRARGFTEVELPENFSLVIKSFPHDMGTYQEVCVKFNDTDEVSCDLAYFLEGEADVRWDEEAKHELGLDGAHGE